MRETTPMTTAVFEDCDAYFDAINDVNVRFTLQGLETSRWQINSLTLPGGINVQRCWSGSGSVAQGVSRAGGFEFAIPATGKYTANAKPVPVESALFMVPGSEFLVSIPGIHSWFGVFVPDSLATSIGVVEDEAGHVRGRTQVLHNAQPDSGSVPALLTRFFASLRLAPDLIRNEQVLRRFEGELLTTLGNAYGSAASPRRTRPGRPVVVDQVSVNRALDVIEASSESAVAMSALAEATNVSERSLRAGFRKYLGMSPTRYMQLRALSKARRRLAASGPEALSVAEVATDLGLWDLGRFAGRYRAMFGELPSSTLRRTSRAA